MTRTRSWSWCLMLLALLLPTPRSVLAQYVQRPAPWLGTRDSAVVVDIADTIQVPIGVITNFANALDWDSVYGAADSGSVDLEKRPGGPPAPPTLIQPEETTHLLSDSAVEHG